MPKPAPGTAAARLVALERELPEQKAPGGRNSKRTDREGNAQISVIEQFDLEYPQYAGRLFHVANGGKRTKFERYILTRQGVRRGVPDLILPVVVAPYHGLYIEMKAEEPHDSPLTDNQTDWIQFLANQGYSAQVARGALAAMDIIRRYLISDRGPA